MKFLVSCPRQGSKLYSGNIKYKTPSGRGLQSKLTYPINILSYTVLPHRKQVYSPSCNNNSWLIIYPTRTHNQHLHPCMPCWSESTCKLHSIQSRSLRSLKRKVSTDPVAMPRHNERKRRPLVGRAYVCVESQYSTNVVQRDPPCWSEPNITFVHPCPFYRIQRGLSCPMQNKWTRSFHAQPAADFAGMVGICNSKQITPLRLVE